MSAYTCKHCGHSLYGERQKGHTYYRCHSAACPTTCVREEAVHTEIRRHLARLAFSPEERSELQTAFDAAREHWHRQWSESTEALQLKLGSLNSRLARLTDAFLDGTVDKDLFQERKASFLMERQELSEQLAGLEQQPNGPIDRLHEILELGTGALIQYEVAPDEEKRDLVKNLFSNQAVDRKQLTISMYFPFQAMAERGNLRTSGPHQYTSRTDETLVASGKAKEPPQAEYTHPMQLLVQILLKWIAEGEGRPPSPAPGSPEQTRG